MDSEKASELDMFAIFCLLAEGNVMILFVVQHVQDAFWISLAVNCHYILLPIQSYSHSQYDGSELEGQWKSSFVGRVFGVTY